MRHIESTLNKKQIFLSRIFAGCAIFLYGLLILLASLNLLSVSVKSLAIPLLLCVFSLLLLALALVQQNTLLLWLLPLTAFLSISLFLRAFEAVPLKKIYPLIVAAPALGSAFCGLYSGIWKDHLKVILIFAPTAAIFCLNTIFGVKFAVVAAIGLIFLGLAAAAHTIISRKKINDKKGENNEPN